MASPKHSTVEGRPTDEQCPHCGERSVLVIYHRFASQVMFCTSCEQVWTVRGPRPGE